jgi:peptidoglycan/LPS O-acetylase OafA/YrhL
MRRRPELDGVRAIAVAAVVLSHLGISIMLGGWIGVDIFFVLSGYLITTVLMREWDNTGRIRLLQFYARRALRLYPALIFMLVLSAFFYGRLGDGGSFLGFGKTALVGATYTEDLVLGYTGNPVGNLGHTWTLAMEEQFYLIWAPSLLVLLKRHLNPMPFLIGAAAVSWLLLTFTSDPNSGLPLTYYRPDSRANELILGCILALFLIRHPPSELFSNRLLRSWLAPMSLVMLIVLEIVAAHLGRQHVFPLEEFAAGMLAAGLLLGLTVAPETAPLTRILGTWPFRSIGKISYGIYLFMIPVLFVLSTYYPLSKFRTFCLMYFAILIGIASLSYFVVERPFLRWKDRLSKSEVDPQFAGLASLNLELQKSRL